MSSEYQNKKLEKIEKKLESISKELYLTFLNSRNELKNYFDEKTLIEWTLNGLKISQGSQNALNTGKKFFEISSFLYEKIPRSIFNIWMEKAVLISNDSSSLGYSYLISSPSILNVLRPRYLQEWSDISKNIYSGSWKTNSLASKFMESSPFLLKTISFDDLKNLSDYLNNIAVKSCDLAIQNLEWCKENLSILGNNSSNFIVLLKSLSNSDWREINEFFEFLDLNINKNKIENITYLIQLLLHFELEKEKSEKLKNDIDSFYQNQSNIKISDFTKTFLSITEKFGNSDLENIFNMNLKIIKLSPRAANNFNNSINVLLEKLTNRQLKEWFSTGLEVLKKDIVLGQMYFAMETEQSILLLDTLSYSVDIEREKEMFKIYCAALSGKQLEIQSSEKLVEKKIGWLDSNLATTEGTTIFLPQTIKRFNSKKNNFAWYKVIATHQTGHVEFGSFEFNFSRKSSSFIDLRSRVWDLKSPRIINDYNKENDPEQNSKSYLTDISKFLDLFDDSKLALDIFTLLEASRIDKKVLRVYQGIKEDYLKVQNIAITNRPKIEELPTREALVEILIRYSINPNLKINIPKIHKDIILSLFIFVDKLNSPKALVEDSAEATIRIYKILSEIENTVSDEQEFDELDPNQGNQNEEINEENDQEIKDILDYFQSFEGVLDFSNSTDDSSNSEVVPEEPDYKSSQEVEYRGDFKPELSQLLYDLQIAEGTDLNGENINLSESELEEMIKNSPEIQDGDSTETDQIDGDVAKNIADLIDKLDGQESKSGGMFSDSFGHVDETGNGLVASGKDQYVYDEWDFRAKEYKKNWCLVNEKRMSEGESDFYDETLLNYSDLMKEIRKQFELIVPENYRKIKRLEDGEEQDLDLVIEAMTDLRAGITPSEKLFWRRNKVERDIAVAFLLDMSASTAEAIEDTKFSKDDWSAPDDPEKYMEWLRKRRSQGLRRGYKRIIDLEKEGIILLIEALETLGDFYGIYGFSGYGRENVEFFVMKEIEEKFSSEVSKRIDRVSPLHATRMGPAIRHTIKKLENVEAKSRFLFLISDGRPQDRGYSREGVEKEYAVNDTKKALQEAKSSGITPFCLTVDKQGHDYMKNMMDDMSYEVLDNISLLPLRLPELYKALTMT
jgi:hypothetical protein